MKNKIRILASGIAILLASYLIGQNIILPLRSPEASEGPTSAMGEAFDWIEGFDNLELYGYGETDDNPWSSTVAKIDASGEVPGGIFITSGTGVGANVELKEGSTLEISAGIHPWVAEYSDGAVLEIQYLESGKKESKLLGEYEIKDQTQVSIEVGLGEYANTKGIIKVICSAEKSGDSSGDWILITRMNLGDGMYKQEGLRDGQGGFLCSVHYFADEWPINFWSCELLDIGQDFEQIVSDGFNSIILVVPWREFQPTFSPVSYNEDALEKLRMIMEKAEEYDLSVMVRVGYIWDYYQDEESQCTERFYDIVGNQEVQEAWFDYCETLYYVLNEYPNFVGGFITWEDFWSNIYLGDVLGEEEQIVRAERTGFQKWVRDHYSITQLKEQYGAAVKDYSEIGIPKKTDSMMELWYAFIDEFLMRLLEESQEYFPDLSMEVRTDWDIYYNTSGEQEYYQHNKTYPCADSSFTSIMYGIPQGCLNQGERLHYDEAMEKTEYILRSIMEQNQKKPIYIDQFLFADNTPGFEMNAQIYDDELEDYLKNVDSILEKYTLGYGVWAYKNYAANLLYNPQFGKDMEGWETDNSEIIVKDGNKKMQIREGGQISQTIPGLRIQYPSPQYSISMDVIVEGDTNITLVLGKETKTMKMQESGKISVKFTVDTPDWFSISADKDIIVDNVKVYNHVQNGFLYDLEGNGQEALDGIRYLNNHIGNH